LFADDDPVRPMLMMSLNVTSTKIADLTDPQTLRNLGVRRTDLDALIIDVSLGTAIPQRLGKIAYDTGRIHGLQVWSRVRKREKNLVLFVDLLGLGFTLHDPEHDLWADHPTVIKAIEDFMGTHEAGDGGARKKPDDQPKSSESTLPVFQLLFSYAGRPFFIQKSKMKISARADKPFVRGFCNQEHDAQERYLALTGQDLDGAQIHFIFCDPCVKDAMQRYPNLPKPAVERALAAKIDDDKAEIRLRLSSRKST